MPLYDYRWTFEAIDRCAANGVDWREADYVIHQAHPNVRRHIGANLWIAAADRHGHIMAVRAIETEIDNCFEIQSAQYLDGPEAAAVATYLNEFPGGTA